MLIRFIVLLAAVHAIAFLVGAAVLQSPYLLGAALFMGAVGSGALALGKRQKGRGGER